MKWRAIRAIIRKDLSVVTRSKGVMLPMIIVPVIFLILIPGLVSLVPNLVNMPGMSFQEFDSFLQTMPHGLQDTLSPYTMDQRAILIMLVYIFAPLFLIIPLMVSSVIAADSFAGEKERKTIEALLYSPVTDGELFLAKALSAWTPALAVTFGGFVIYGLMVNLTSWPTMGRVFFPNIMWVVMVLWVAPAAAGLGLGSMVLVSSRVASFQEANQIGGVVVLPIVILVIGQASGVIFFSTTLVLLLGLALWVVDGILLWFGAQVFERERMITDL